jgi:hypothetical protein
MKEGFDVVVFRNKHSFGERWNSPYSGSVADYELKSSCKVAMPFFRKRQTGVWGTIVHL